MRNILVATALTMGFLPLASMTIEILRLWLKRGGENMITVEELRTALNNLDNTLNNKYIQVVQGYEGTYLILEKKLGCRKGREVVEIK